MSQCAAIGGRTDKEAFACQVSCVEPNLLGRHQMSRAFVDPVCPGPIEWDGFPVSGKMIGPIRQRLCEEKQLRIDSLAKTIERTVNQRLSGRPKDDLESLDRFTASNIFCQVRMEAMCAPDSLFQSLGPCNSHKSTRQRG